jgi:hypothetical protein
LFRCKKFSNVKCFQIQIISRKIVYFSEFDCILKNVQENIKKKNYWPQILNKNPAATTSSTSQSNPPPTQTTTILQANHNQKPTTTTANPFFNQIQPITNKTKNKLTKHLKSDLRFASPCNDKFASPHHRNPTTTTITPSIGRSLTPGGVCVGLVRETKGGGGFCAREF